MLYKQLRVQLKVQVEKEIVNHSLYKSFNFVCRSPSFIKLVDIPKTAIKKAIDDKIVTTGLSAASFTP